MDLQTGRCPDVDIQSPLGQIYGNRRRGPAAYAMS